jgi:hypothetical protein
VLGIGLARLLWLGPVWRLIAYAWDASYGRSGSPALNTAVGILFWSVLPAIEIWFCLSALSWWTAIRDDNSPASPGQHGCQASHA